MTESVYAKALRIIEEQREREKMLKPADAIEAYDKLMHVLSKIANGDEKSIEARINSLLNS